MTNPTAEPAPPPPPAPPSATCVLCAAPRRSITDRCEVCGLHPGLGRSEVDPFDTRARWWIAGVFVAIYVAVFVGVAVAN